MEEILFAKREFRAGTYESTKGWKNNSAGRNGWCLAATNLWACPGPPAWSKPGPGSPPTTWGGEGAHCGDGIWCPHTRGLLLCQVPWDTCIHTRHTFHSRQKCGRRFDIDRNGVWNWKKPEKFPQKTHSLYKEAEMGLGKVSDLPQTWQPGNNTTGLRTQVSGLPNTHPLSRWLSEQTPLRTGPQTH